MAIEQRIEQNFDTRLMCESLNDRAITRVSFVPLDDPHVVDAIEHFDGREDLGSVDAYTIIDRVPVSQSKFMIYYAQTHNRIAAAAVSLLKAHTSLESLLDARHDFLSGQNGHGNGMFVNGDLKSLLDLPEDADTVDAGSVLEDSPEKYDAALEIVNDGIKRQIIHLAITDDDREIQHRGFDLAKMLLEHEEASALVRQNIVTQAEGVQQHVAIMRTAIENAKDENISANYPQAETVMERAFLVALDMKLQQNGYIPPLISIHDADRNLRDDEDSTVKPGQAIGRLVNHLDEIVMKQTERKLQPYQRLLTTDRAHYDEDPLVASVASALLVRSGRVTGDIFVDAKDAADIARQNNIPFQILTANMSLYGKGIAAELHPDDFIHVHGMEHDSFVSREKPLRLADAVISHPDGIILFSDDADRSVSEAIARGEMVSGVGIAPENMVFFASRVQGDGEDSDYRLARVLKERDIPFAENRRTITNDGHLEGYQGTKRMMELYANWRYERLHEGWAEDLPGLQAQQRIRAMIESAPDTIQALHKKIIDDRQEKIEGITSSEFADTRLMDDLSYTIRMQTALLEGSYGFDLYLLKRAVELYQSYIADNPYDSDIAKGIVASQVFRQASKETHDQRRRNGEIQQITSEGTVRIGTIANETIAVVNAGMIKEADVDEFLRRGDVQVAFESGARYSIVQFCVENGGIKPTYKTIVISRPDDHDERLNIPRSVSVLDGRGVLLPNGDFAGTPEKQLELFRRSLHQYLRMALLYYRNPFAEGGGLEKAMRYHAKVLRDAGFSVRLIGGNAPDKDTYGAEVLGQYEHYQHPSIHERQWLTLRVAKALEKGVIRSQDYQHIQHELRDFLQDALNGVNTAMVHNPLMLRNVPFTEALIRGFQHGDFHITNLVGVVHDTGMSAEPKKFHRAEEFHVPELPYYDGETNNPWRIANTRFSGVSYVAVSRATQDRLNLVPFEDSTDVISGAYHAPTENGSDYLAMFPDTRVNRILGERINWNNTQRLFVATGRVAERKNVAAAVEATALIKDATLVITGAPKYQILPDGTKQIDDPYFLQVRRLAEQMGIEDRVLFLADALGGSITDAEYDETTGSLYQLVDGVFVLSDFEGFGIDAGNAAAFNPNMVVTNDAALMDNLGRAASYVPIRPHAVQSAVAMVATIAGDRRDLKRVENRTIRAWDQSLSGVFPLVGTEMGEVIYSSHS